MEQNLPSMTPDTRIALLLDAQTTHSAHISRFTFPQDIFGKGWLLPSKMSASNFTPYGVKSLLECMSRATLLAQPDDIPEFLSTHVDKMTHVRDEESRDTKEVTFQYEEQWGKSGWYFNVGIDM